MGFVHEDYLGDGVYALFDGFAIWLRANDAKQPTDEICLEPSVVRSLYRFNEHCEELIRSVQQKSKESESQVSRPDCYKCQHRGTIPGDCHSSCSNLNAKVEGTEHGIKSGWFFWPLNFDPRWLTSCNGFKAKEDNQC